MPDENDKNLNPGQADYDRKTAFDPSGKGTNENSDQNSTASELKNNEENPDNKWNNKYTGQKEALKADQKRNLTHGKALIRIGKKKGPLLAIILTVLGGGTIIGALLSPGLLLVQMKEVLTDKFNTQLTSMDVRTTKALAKKFNATSEICTAKVSIKCRYSSMSEKQIKNFKKAGITVKFDADKPSSLLSLGRKKPTSFIFEGKEITAKSFSSEIKTNPTFRVALKKAYNPLYAGFSDSIWKKSASVLKTSKSTKTFEGDDYDSKMSNLEDDLQESNKLTKQPTYEKGDINPDTGEVFSSDDLETANSQINTLNDLVDDAGGDGSVSSKILNGATEVSNTIKITGVVDNACTAYRTFRAIGYAAKTVRVLQLASFSMLFLNIADQIKAGDANPDDVSFLGTILTNTSEDDQGNALSATDSYGYKYAAYGDLGSTDTNTMRFMAAAGLSGIMVNFFSHFSVATSTCKFLANPIVGLASLTGGAVLTFFSGGTNIVAGTATKVSIKAAIKTAAKEAAGSIAFWKSKGAAIGTGLALAEIFLPGLLKDIVAGNTVDSTTVGANAGDAITSGASVIMGTTAKLGGNSPLTPEQAVSYKELSTKVAAQYAEEDRITKSPFDTTSKNTFLGSIVSNILPYSSKITSISSFFTSLASFTANSLTPNISSTTKAASTDEYSSCQDYEYKKIGVATDPMCNIIYGIPSEYLDIDPYDIVDYLVGHKQIYEYDGDDHEAGDVIENSEYDSFISKCINRTDPLGYKSDNSESTDGSECFINASTANKYYYLYYIDQRVQSGLDDDSDDDTSTSSYDNKTAQEIAKIIIAKGTVKDTTGQIAEVAAGSRSDIDVDLLKFIANLSQNNTFTISSLKRDYIPVNGSENSYHLTGKAVDISGSNPINGETLNYTGYSNNTQKFINEASSLLGTSCQIGLPNNSYVSNTKSTSSCVVFKDIGTGPHIHFAVGG